MDSFVLAFLSWQQETDTADMLESINVLLELLKFYAFLVFWLQWDPFPRLPI